MGKYTKKGAAIGTERSTTSQTYVTYSEDFSGLKHGDLLQIYAKVGPDALYSCTVKEFKVCFS